MLRLEVLVREARRHREGLAGVRSTLVSPAPFNGARSATGARRGDAPDSPAVSTFLAAVSPDFPDVVDLQMARGRWFSSTADEEVVINESLASRLWRGGDPIGQRLTTGDVDRRIHVVVGVVRDAPYVPLVSIRSLPCGANDEHLDQVASCGRVSHPQPAGR